MTQVDNVDRIDRVDIVDKVELSLAKPGGGEASRESALPIFLLACPSGGWPLNLLEVRIVGTKVACNIRGWQYIVVKKLISSSFLMTAILLREVTELTGLNFPRRSQGKVKPPGTQRSQFLSSPAPREVGLSVSLRSAL